MIAVLSFLLDYEKIENDDEDSDDLISEDEMTQNPQVVISKETVYKVISSCDSFFIFFPFDPLSFFLLVPTR